MSNPDLKSVCFLSLRITPGDGKCGQYRRSGSASCHGCTAWEQLQQHISEVGEMGTKGKTCDVDGCETMSWKAGKCWKHHPNNIAKRKPNTRAEIITATVTAPPAVPSRPKHKMCSVPGCTHHVTRKRLCWSHLKMIGINPQTGEPMQTAPAPALVPEQPAQVSTDPRVSFECPHCNCALNSLEVEGLECPVCNKPLHTHLTQCGEVFTPAVAVRDGSPFENLGFEIGQLVAEKNKAYGNSFAVCGVFLRLLYPDGIRPEQYEDALGLVRVFDKQMRIATDRDALGESPWQDISGYGLLGVARSKGIL